MAEGGYSSGTWGEAGWGGSVYERLITNSGWSVGAWGSGGWGIGDGGIVSASDQTAADFGQAQTNDFATASDVVTAYLIAISSVSESATSADQFAGSLVRSSSVSETSTGADTVAGATILGSF